MTKKSAIKSKHNSTVVSVAVGTILAVILSLVGATIGSMLLDGGKTSESAVYPVTIVTWIVSAFLGTFATMKLASASLEAQYTIGSPLITLNFSLSDT